MVVKVETEPAKVTASDSLHLNLTISPSDNKDWSTVKNDRPISPLSKDRMVEENFGKTC